MAGSYHRFSVLASIARHGTEIHYLKCPQALPRRNIAALLLPGLARRFPFSAAL
jgi:hypothetical protein